jgi:hypothetical protein
MNPLKIPPLTLTNYTPQKDYIVRMAKNIELIRASKKDGFPDIDMTGQAVFGMAAGIVMDAVWQRVVKEELGLERMNQLALKFWEIIGEYSYPLVQMLLQIPQPEKASWGHVKKVIKGIYRAYMVPLEIVRDDDDCLEFQILACPYEAYKGLFDVVEDDFVCRNWRDVHTAWLFGLINKAGLAEEVPLSNMTMDGAMCCGKDTCHVIVKRARK